MANIGSSKQISRPTLDKYLGLNQNVTGDTGILYGESGDMENVIITDDYKLSRSIGYEQMFEPLPDPIIAQYPGTLNGVTICIFAAGGTMYSMNKDTGVYTSIGSYTGDYITFFTFNDLLYALNTTTYQKWDGTGVFVNVEGYVPLFRINGVPSTGAGDLNEEFNLLTGKKHMTYNGDALATIYQLPETNIDSVDLVEVDGVTQVEGINYLVSLALGRVIFTNPSKPKAGTNNVDIYWDKDTGTREEFAGNKYVLAFGLRNDTRVFFYGDPENKNRIRFTDLADGIQSAEYIPADHYTDVSDAGIYVKDLMQYQGKILIFKSNELHSGTLEYVTENSGRVELILTTLPLTTVETLPFNQGKIINGIPVQIGKQLYRVLETYVKEERNIQTFSDRIKYDLNSVDLTQAVSLDIESTRQYVVAVGKVVWVYSYVTDTFSRLRLAHTPTCGNEFDNILYFSCVEGTVMRYDDELVTYNGIDMGWYWNMNFEDYGADYRRKSLKRLHVTVDPTRDQYMNITTVTDKDGLSTTSRVVDIKHMTFLNMNFANFSFNTTYLPKPTRLKMNSKKFTYLSIRLDGGEEAKPLTLINMTPKIVYGGESK